MPQPQRQPAWLLFLALAALLVLGRQTYVPPIAPTELPLPAEEDNISRFTRSGRLNLNTATAGELELLPGLGPKKAATIIEYRQQQGCFKNLESLLEIRGIGPKTIEKWRNYLTVDGCTEEASP